MIKRMVAADYTNLRRRTDEVVLRFDKRDDGWQLVQHTPQRLKDGASLEFVSFLKGDEPKISGEEMRRRAVKMGANFGQEDLEFLLDHPERVPPRGKGVVLHPVPWHPLARPGR